MRRLFWGLLLAALVAAPAHARSSTFTVEDIRVEGLQRIALGTVLNYLPIDVHDTVDAELLREAVRSLYRTAFFEDVTLARDGNVLIVRVAERPAIASIELEGNHVIQDEPLMAALRDIGLVEGQVFNRSLLNNIERELRAQYLNRARYDMRVESTVSPMPRNRVGVRIDIHEGAPARIREINLIGNESFPDKTLKGLFEQGPRRWYQLFSRRDQYSRERMQADLERLSSFYHDRGFLEFAVDSAQVSISPDRQSIFVTVSVSEGEQFHIGEVELAGDLIVAEAELRELLEVEPGELYSRRNITNSADRIRDRLGEEGYAFARVNPVPELDERANVVGLTYYVDPGDRVYVRRINISGNDRTQDEVIRREIRQMEGGWLSNERVRRSQTRLDRLGFFSRVDIDTVRVPGAPDQVDLNVQVAERLSGTLQAGLGYGDTQGVLVNFSVAQDNLLGNGDRLNFTINNSPVNQIYSLNYLERYHTLDGISRNFVASYRRTEAGRAYIIDYGVRTATLGFGYGIPVNENDVLNIDFAYETLGIDLPSDPYQAPADFVAQEGDDFINYKAMLGWTRDTRNRAIFPNRGGRQRVSGEASLPGSDLEFYKLTYEHRRWFPITQNWTLSAEARFAYGDGYGDTERLPFFENFFAGGVSTIRGFRGNALGPTDRRQSADSRERPLGGNARILGRVELIGPIPGADLDSVRLLGFWDAGNVFDTYTGSVDTDEFRYSVGLGLIWYSPVGALAMSLGWPLNAEPEDETQRFQFQLGTFF